MNSEETAVLQDLLMPIVYRVFGSSIDKLKGAIVDVKWNKKLHIIYGPIFSLFGVNLSFKNF